MVQRDVRLLDQRGPRRKGSQRPPVAEERQRDPDDRQKSDDHQDVDEKLEGDEEGRREDDIDPRPVAGFGHGQEHPGQQREIDGDDRQNAEEARLFADDGENEVGVARGQEAELALRSLLEPPAGQAA